MRETDARTPHHKLGGSTRSSVKLMGNTHLTNRQVIIYSNAEWISKTNGNKISNTDDIHHK